MKKYTQIRSKILPNSKNLTNFAQGREKNLIEFENLSLNLTKWGFFSHKNMGPESTLLSTE